MKWLMVVSCLDAADGGPPAAVLGLAMGLRELGEQVTILTHRHTDLAVHESAVVAEAAGVRIRWVERDHPTRFQFSPALLKAARAEAASADSITCHGFYQWTCVVGYLVARDSDRPLLLQPHGVFEPFQEQETRRVKRTFRTLIGNRILHRVSAIVAASESEAAGFRRTLGSHMPAVVVAGLGVDTRVQPGPHDFSSRRVMFLSRVAPKKRLDKLLAAARILHDEGRPITVTVCGDGDRDLVAELHEVFDEGVVWRGHVVDPERREIEESHALMCLPSDNENFGQVVIESMARGLPVITTAATGSSTHLTQAEAGWVLDSPDTRQLANAIDAALSDPEELAAMGARGAAYARDELVWTEIAEHWVEHAAEWGDRRVR